MPRFKAPEPFFKPYPGRVQLNHGHPLAKDLRMALLCLENGTSNPKNYGVWAPITQFSFGANGPLWTADPKFQRAWAFTNTNSDQISAGGFFGNPSAISMAVWANSTKGSQADLISFGDNHLIRTQTTRGIYRFASNWNTIGSGRNDDNTGWHLYAFTVMAGAQALYLDGLLIGAATNSQAPIYDQGSNTYIGINGGGAGFNPTGNIGPAYMWGRYLSAAEVLDLYLHPFGMLVQPKQRFMFPPAPPPPQFFTPFGNITRKFA